MRKPSSTYKMSKAGKTYLAVNWNRPMLGLIKKGLIQAELAEQIQPRARDRNSK